MRRLIAILIAITGIFFLLWNHLPEQDPIAYFDFADKRQFFGVANFWDVISNLAFLIVGGLGLFATTRNDRLLFSSLAVASVLTCMGSSYFHLNPNPETLFWDRLPMTIAFAAIIGLIVSDRVNVKAGRLSFYFFSCYGLVSVTGWHFGWFTLKPYIALQGGCMIFTVLALAAFRRSRHLSDGLLFRVSLFYFLAKVFELQDEKIFNLTGQVSGHSLKHVAAAIAIGILLKSK